MGKKHQKKMSVNERAGIFPVTLGRPRLTRLKALAAAKGITVAEVVRQAVDRELAREAPAIVLEESQ